jgi:chromate transporter
MILLAQLFYVFLYIGLLSFGGGNAMYPLLAEVLVDQHRWLTSSQMVDLFALAQMTPGPVATNAATFVGYAMAGFWGSAVATVAVSLPSMLVMVGLVTFTTTSRERKLVEGPLYGLRPTVIALILAAAVDIGRQSIADPLGGLIGIGALVAAFGRVNPILIILGGGTLGLLLA